MKYLAEAHRGVSGFVMDELGNPVEKASLKIKGRDVGFQTTKYGEFWRILLPGVYKLEVNNYSSLIRYIITKIVLKNLRYMPMDISQEKSISWLFMNIQLH